MALRSGYYGLKNAVKKRLLDFLSTHENSVVINSIGEGLVLDEKNELSVSGGGGGGGIELSTTEHKVGTWNGKDLYEKTLTATLSGGSGTQSININQSGITEIVHVAGMAGYGTYGKRPIPAYDGSTIKVGFFDTALDKITLVCNSTNDWRVYLYVFYTKN